MISLGLSCLFYIVTGLQVWYAHYLEVVLGLPSARADIYYSIVTITAPIGGAILSSVISSKIGGHESPWCLVICGSCSLGATIFAVIFPFLDNPEIACCCSWMVLFFGGLILPMLTGVMLSTVTMEQRAAANGIANFTYNILGYFPAPAIYGLVDNLSGQPKPRVGMIVTMYMTLFATFFIVYSYFVSFKGRIFGNYRDPAE